jgi:hypothetical protein
LGMLEWISVAVKTIELQVRRAPTPPKTIKATRCDSMRQQARACQLAYGGAKAHCPCRRSKWSS